jgi:hypothetical protein
MTTNDFNSIEQQNDTDPLFTRFKWHQKAVEKATIPGYRYAELAGMVRDVASGCATILQLVDDSSIRHGCDEPQLLSKFDIGNLTRLAIHSLETLNNIATEELDWAYEYHTPEGKAERLARKNN